MRRRALLALVLPTLAAAQVARETPMSNPDPLGNRLFQAVQGGKVETVRALLARGADPTGTQATGGPLLSFVGGTPDEMLAVARLLVERGAKVDPPFGITNQTPLTHALGAGREPAALVRFLLEKGADPNRPQEGGFTPLHSAVRNGYAASAALLLEKGARLDARTNDHNLVRLENLPPNDPLRPDMVRAQAQIDHVFEPGYRDSGQTPVFGLAGRFDPATAALILKAGARLDERDDNGWTPLHHAAQSGNLAAVRGLLALGASPNAESKGGFTPLHLALRTGFGFPNAPVAQALLEGGADPKGKNRAGQTPLDLLRADVQWRLGNPAHDPQLTFPQAYRAGYLQTANAVAKLLDPKAAPVVFTPVRPDPKGTAYAPLDLGGNPAERTVRVENGRAVLDLRLTLNDEAISTLTIKAIALENYDTLTPLPVVVRRTEDGPATLRFEFPLGAAKGGGLALEFAESGPGFTGGEGLVNDAPPAIASFAYGKDIAVLSDLVGRTIEFEILSVTRGGRPLKGFAGRVVRVEGGKPAPLVGLRADPSGDLKHPKTVLRYRYRVLPNVRWHPDSIAL